MSLLNVDKIDPNSGTALEIGTSGDTVTVPSGVGLTLTDSTLLLPTTITSTTEVKTNKISPATGTAFALGDSGDTFTVPSGATIANLGTATGFGGITEADQWRLTTNFTGDADPIASNLERADQSGWGKIGTGMAESSGIFTFPSTGIWKVEYNLASYYNGENRYTTAVIQATTNDSAYNDFANSDSGWASGGSNIYGFAYCQTLIDCTDTSNVKVRFKADVEDNSTSIQGDTNTSRTYMLFTRLGDT